MKSLREAMGPMLGSVARATGTGASLAPVWEALVGEVLARHTRPVSLAQGVLTVRCDAPAWKDALEPERGTLLRRLQASIGSETVLRSLVFESP